MRVTDEMVEAAQKQLGFSPADGVRLRAALEAALAVEGTRGGPVAYRHTIMEPDKSEPQVLLSFSVKNPWSHWVAAHRDKCSYHVTPLYTAPPAGIREAPVKRAIGNGMAIAAGIVMKCWGDTVTAGEILGAAGYRTIDDLKKDGVDQYDIDLVKPALRGQS